LYAETKGYRASAASFCGAVNQGIRFLAHQPRGRGANRLGGSFVVAADLHAGECK